MKKRVTKAREGKVGRKRLVGEGEDLGTEGKMGWGGGVRRRKGRKCENRGECWRKGGGDDDVSVGGRTSDERGKRQV